MDSDQSPRRAAARVRVARFRWLAWCSASNCGGCQGLSRCCIRTVQDALQAARKLGLLEWWHQRVRRAWRALRAVNRYELRMPTDILQPGPHGPGRTTGKSCRGDTQQGKTKASERSSGAIRAMLEAARGLPDLLKARREAMEARWKAATAARSG